MFLLVWALLLKFLYVSVGLASMFSCVHILDLFSFLPVNVVAIATTVMLSVGGVTSIFAPSTREVLESSNGAKEGVLSTEGSFLPVVHNTGKDKSHFLLPK